MLSLAAMSLVPGTVTLQSPAHPIKDLLPVLSKAVGEELRADASVMDDVVAFDVHDMAPGTFMKELGSTLLATWERDGKRLVLRRPAAALRGLTAADAENQTKWIEPALKKPPTRSQRDAAGTGTDAAREAAVRLGAKELGKVGPGQRMVWSNHANRFQQPLGPAFLVMAERELDRERERLVALRNRVATARPADAVGIDQTLQGLSKPVDEVHVIVARPFDSDDLAIQFRSFAANGDLMLRSRYLLPTPSPAAAEPGLRLRWSPLQAEICRRSAYAGEALPSPEVSGALADPVALDPLEVLVTPHLKQIADGKDWMAWIPDGAYFGARNAFQASADANRFLRTTGIVSEPQGALMVFKPANPARALLKTPREELRALISAMAPVGHPTVPALARFLNRCSVPFAGSSLANAVLESLYAAGMYDREDEELRVKYISLATVLSQFRGPQWAGTSNRRVTIGELTAAQIAALNETLLGGIVPSLDRDSPLAGLSSQLEATILRDQFARSEADLRVSVRETPYAESVGGDRGYTYGTRRAYQLDLRVFGPTADQRPFQVTMIVSCFERDRLSGPTPVPPSQVPAAFRVGAE